MGGLQDAITNLELLLNTVSIASVTASYETTQHMVKQYCNKSPRDLCVQRVRKAITSPHLDIHGVVLREKDFTFV